ncbi:hypothetical protein AB4Y44_27915 [Paraburkholderia sp. BR10937]|uniref:hypothetical protein n=1 Tax=Paraburkholderia sp. BR10937 TaxID=3236994 RepID=UPI0034D25CE6
MSANGGFGVVLELSESALQASLDAFVAAVDQQLSHQITRPIPLAEFAMREDISWVVTLQQPEIHLEHDRTIGLALGVLVKGTAQTRLDPLPGGAVPRQPPTLTVALSGNVAIEVGAVRTSVAGKPCLALDLTALRVTSFDLDIGDTDLRLSTAGLTVLSAIVRRAAVYILAHQVSLIPIGFTIDAQVPILGDLHIPIVIDYKVVKAGDGSAALAILMQVMNEKVDWNEVGYAIAAGASFAILMSLPLIQYALDKTCASLQGYRVFPPSGGLKGDLIFEDAHMHVQPGRFVLDGIKVQSSTLQQVENTVTETICTVVDPFNLCNQVCNAVTKTVIDWVQLDELGHASGDFSPGIKDGNFVTDANNINVDISLPVKLLIFTTADALLPVGGFVSVVLMIVGKILADRAVTGFVDNETETGVIDRPIPGTQLQFRAAATKIDWPDGCLALYGDFSVEHA